MTDREKLIDLIHTAIARWEHGDASEHIADHLMANGVTVQREGRWTGREYDLVYECSACGYQTEYLLSHYCPRCGAWMDRK